MYPEGIEVLGAPKTRPWWWYLGPGFLVSVGYMDPGNWVTSLEAGSRYGLALLFVVTLASAMAVLFQALAVRLGVATGKDLAEHMRARYPGGLGRLLFLTTFVAMVATDLAEFMGMAVALNLLFGLPLVLAAWLTVLDVFLILYLERFGFRALELAVSALVGVVGLAYVVEVVLARPEPGPLLRHLFLPSPALADLGALYVALGILGATVMPHNLFLHSAQVKTCLGEAGKRVYRLLLDTALALSGAWLVNAAILVVAATVFHQRGLVIADLAEAYHTLGPLLGPLAALAFGVALLASGLSSTTTGTLAAQVVVEGFTQARANPARLRLVTRLLAVLPASLALTFHASPMALIVLSQVVLSFRLPFTLFPLVRLVGEARTMGSLVAPGWLRLLAWAGALLVLVLNLFLLVQALAS
ncbi:Nramp family divalent metal transporter [Thermus thermophilus]|uniref:Nramp family divalent metal transporter n=1 Tax=Thermus thermophilus TaxID=274 RepID=UPI0011638267|nr:Nramp family divalent metal transporter [Thermus thermophilus]BBL83354.1 divalent metal cation transporter MntH [Thermus thermophilus]BBL85627.1 divalent metal cation transporter MntH [Thermus thermophilus]BCZ95672.1 divalent metal cation transporter MntH [Thermus thermophilus]